MQEGGGGEEVIALLLVVQYSLQTTAITPSLRVLLDPFVPPPKDHELSKKLAENWLEV